MKINWIVIAACGVLFCFHCNPFAPQFRESDDSGNLLGDPTSIEGFYTRFQNAYRLRDTTLYGPLIHPEFTFTYRDYDSNVDVSWGRVEELLSTTKLFQFSREIDLTWNNTIVQLPNTDNTQVQIIRRFDLIVTLDGSDVLRTDGSANFVLERADSTLPWLLRSWRDQSEL